METQSTPTKSKKPVLVLFVVLLALAGAGYWFFGRGSAVTTDDAYVNGHLIRLTPQVTGVVTAVHTDTSQYVRQGEVLVEFDNEDARVALQQAEAALGETVREVAQLYANRLRDDAAVANAETQVERSRNDLDRDLKLESVHGVSQEDLQHDRDALRAAEAALNQARAVLAATRASITGTSVETHPRVQQAEATLRSAWLAVARTKVLAPVSGYVVRRTVELGQQVSLGTELLAIVPLDSVWVDANFKETELANLRIGQPVTVAADIYGSHLKYHGHVLGLVPGTGSALAVLPAQNASGNWIKIVQRLPVRIGLDPGELKEHPLFVGLSADVSVDASNRDGSGLSTVPTWPSTVETPVYGVQLNGVEDDIRRIVDANHELKPAQSIAHS